MICPANALSMHSHRPHTALTLFSQILMLWNTGGELDLLVNLPPIQKPRLYSAPELRIK